MGLPYRKGVGIFLLNNKKDLWIGRRIDNKNEFWQMPQGGKEECESYSDAMFRELKEEVGTNNVKILKESNCLLTYDLPKNLINNVWSGKYKGQAQKWFACEFLGKDSEINIEYFEPEFCEWKWIKPYQIKELAVPFKREMYVEILDIFSDLYN